jgi:hypothetical protein
VKHSGVWEGFVPVTKPALILLTAIAVLAGSAAGGRLKIPPLAEGVPAAGKRVLVTAPEYEGTDVYHSLYLPEEWTPDGKKAGKLLPIIFEYTGNHAPKLGSTGQVKDAGLGFGLSGGKYIWVSLPYIREDGKANQLTWWGDIGKTVGYAKTNVPRIIGEYGGDPKAVFLCGFSRGAIGVNFIGLHDDEIAGLWTAFISHDHFDGVRQWAKPWGAPLEKYREEAAVRLKRVGQRPYLVSHNGSTEETEEFVRSVLPSAGNFTFAAVKTGEIFDKFPNELARHPHTDRWLLVPSNYRERAWEWMNRVAEQAGDRL